MHILGQRQSCEATEMKCSLQFRNDEQKNNALDAKYLELGIYIIIK